MEFHEAANIFPRLEDSQLQALCGDIASQGLKDDVVLCDGKILDGRNRYCACLMGGMEPRYVDISEVEPDYDPETFNPVDYVVSKNLRRRQLTPTALGVCANKARELKAALAERAAERQKKGKGADGSGGRGKKKTSGSADPKVSEHRTRDDIGSQFGVSGAVVDRVARVQRDGVPELQQALEEDRISAKRAAELLSKPEGVQKKEAEAAYRAGGRYRSKTQDALKTEEEPVEEPKPNRRSGKPPVGVILANEALNVLMRIPKNDPLRKRGFQIVTDWIRANQ